MQTQKQQPSQVPIEACRFAAEFKTGSPDAEQRVPFTALARTAQPVPHWYWGERCIHDFSGMESPQSIAVDYEHRDEIIGVVSKFNIDKDGLTCSGFLTPFQATDRASEVAHKSKMGVPYQSSIDFDEFTLVVEDVPAGFSTTVNGDQFTGPLTVFRKWKLQGIAVCKQGVDPNTNVKFSAEQLSGKTVPVTRFSKGGIMPDEVPPTVTPVENEKPAEKPAETGTPTPAAVSQTPPTPAVPAAVTQLSRKQQSEAFIKEFGEQHGAALFSRHDRIEDARIEFGTILRTENEALKTQVAKFAKTSNQAGADPVSFGGGEKSTPTKFSHMGRVGRFAAGIKLPGATK